MTNKESSPVSELAERLRDTEVWLSSSGDIQSDASARAVSEAADRLTALEAENARLRKGTKVEVCKGLIGIAVYVNDKRIYGPRHNGTMTVIAAYPALTAPQGGDHGE